MPPTISPRRPAAGLVDRLVDRLVASCPTPALLVASGGRLRRVNEAARTLWSLGDVDGLGVERLLGLGWRELELMALDGTANLVVAAPDSSEAAGRRGLEVRLEPIFDGAPGGDLDGPGLDGPTAEPVALVAFVEPAPSSPSPTPVVPERRRHRRAAGFDAIFGHDAAVRATKEAAARFARTRLPILLLAETGTGKELLARAIHASSPRRDGPFVAINCGALSPHLLESELFGYAPGSFTGASEKGRDGKIGAAAGGTLFLDEIGEMPGPLQALLLRVLEDGTYYRVGENIPRRADVRLVCATCRDLPRLVEEGAFRQDLFYRVHGARLGLPPLRERSDVAELALHLADFLVAEGAPEDGLPAKRPEIAPETLEILVAYSWPGNVRQLKTALHHALVLSAGDTVRPEHLPPLATSKKTGSGNTLGSNGRPASSFVAAGAAPSTPRRTLAEREADRLRDAVENAGGNLSHAARTLGIARSTLYRRLRKHGLIES